MPERDQLSDQSAMGVPYGYCHCGCGEKTKIAWRSTKATGTVKGEPMRFIHNHHARLQTQDLDRYVIEDRGYSTPCWIWQGFLNTNGYGQVGRNTRAHRAVYLKHVGPIPDGLELDHLCRVPACVNPDHLEPVTHGENMRRGFSVSALNMRKTHCVHGHPFEGANLYTHPSTGKRLCRTCRRLNQRRYVAARKAAA